TGRVGDRLESVGVHAAESSFAGDVGDEDPGEGDRVEALEERFDGEPGRRGPSAGDDDVVADIGGDDDTLRVPLGEGGEPCRVLDGAGTGDDVGGAEAEERFGARVVADAAADLDGGVDGGEDRLDGVAVVSGAQRGIEVDDVEGAEPVVDPAP